MSKNLVHFNTVFLLVVVFCITSLKGQDCNQTAGSISFSGSDEDSFTTSIFNDLNFVNDVTFVIDASTPDAGTHTLLVLDTSNVILSFLNIQDSGCSDRFVFGNTFFPNPQDNERYTLQMISVENLDIDLISGQMLDDLSGCFALSDPLVVNTVNLASLLDIPLLSSMLNASDFNLFGGSITVNDLLELDPQIELDICTIDSTNQALNVTGDVGVDQTWVVTTRQGVLLDTLGSPIFDFAQYVDSLDLSSNLHDLEIFHVSFAGNEDWFTIGNNLKQDICNGPIRSQSQTFLITFIECQTTCNDDLLNGEEIAVDDCAGMQGFSCSISLARAIPCFQDTSGMLEIMVDEDEGPFEYLWNTGDTIAVLDSLPAGTYNVTVTNANAEEATCMVELTEPEELDVTIDLSFNISCTATAVVTGGVRPFTYSWNNDEELISIQNFDRRPNVTVTDSNGCTDFRRTGQNRFEMICGDCEDGIMNNDEAGIDCGGMACQPCMVDSTNLNPIQLTKMVEFIDENSDGFVQEGESFNYTFSVCNISNDTLTQVMVTDPMITVAGMAVSLNPNSCNANAFQGTFTITANDLNNNSLSNQATVTAFQQDTIMVTDLSDDPSVPDNIDLNGDGDPDDPTVFAIQLPGPCGSPFIDTDGDGMCDILDEDDDNDMVFDTEDAFPLDPFESADTDGDGFGDNADFDDDGDLIDDRIDAFPLDPTESSDNDEDGIGDNADLDDDNDNVEDTIDMFPLDASESVDTDNDGTGNNADLDDDNDGCTDEEDPNPLVAGDTCEGGSTMVSCSQQDVGSGQAVFGGQIETQIGYPLDSVLVRIVSADNVSDPVFTDEQGEYLSASVPLGLNYEIRPTKDDLPFPGVSTLDMLFVQRHILRLQSLESPYDIIAADVSGNQDLSVVDIIVMRRLILGVIDEFNVGVTWKFIDADFNFFDPTNPWPFPEAIDLQNVENSDCNLDYVAIRLGDVDGSFEQSRGFTPEERTSSEVSLSVIQTKLANGLMRYDFYPSETNMLYGFQLELNGFDGTASIESKAIDVTDENVMLSEKSLKMAWTNPQGQEMNPDKALFSVTSATDKMPSLINAKLSPEMYLDTDIIPHQVSLNVTAAEGRLTNIIANPNPFSSTVSIEFNHQSNGPVSLAVYDLNGRLILSDSRTFPSGKQVIQINNSQLTENGTYHFTLSSGVEQHSGKIIKVN